MGMHAFCQVSFWRLQNICIFFRILYHYYYYIIKLYYIKRITFVRLGIFAKEIVSRYRKTTVLQERTTATVNLIKRTNCALNFPEFPNDIMTQIDKTCVYHGKLSIDS